MADSILRLKVDSQEYDNKLKRASQSLLQYADGCRKVGGTLEVVEQETLDFVKALGEMSTVSNTARGKLNEMTQAFTDLSVQYKQLTDAEKNSPFGQALAQSLDQLKGRIQESKAQLDDVGKSINGGGGLMGALDGLASKFGLNITQLTGLGAVLGVSKVALDAAKDAFFSSESNVDEWGRTVAESEAIYESFVNSLNTGNFSGFLTNIGRVTQAARDAYNALDELGTRMTIINPERAKLQAEQQRLRATIRREGANSEAGKQATAQLRALEPRLAQSYGTESKMNYNAFEKLVRERLAEGGLNLNQKSFNWFMKTFSDDKAFQQLRASASGKITTQYTAGGRNDEGQVTRVDNRNTAQKLMDLFTDKWRQQNSGYLTAAFNAQGAQYSNALGNSRYLKTQVPGSGSGRTTPAETDQDRASKRMADAQHKYAVALEIAQAEFDRGNITEKDLKTAQRRAAESLFEAADDAYRTYADPQYKTVREDAKQKFVNLGGEVKTLTEIEKANQKTAREQEQAQKKLSDAQKKRADALESGDLRGYLSAGKELRKLGGASVMEDLDRQDAEIPLNFTFTESNLNAFIESLKERLSNAGVGTELASGLSAQLGDATALSTMLGTANKAGLDPAQLGLTSMFKQLFNMTPGDYVSDGEMKNTSKRVRKEAQKRGKSDDQKDTTFVEAFGKLNNGVTSMVGSLEQMGIQIPEGFKGVLSGISGAIGVLQAIMMIVEAIEAMQTVGTFLGIFANGGIVPHAAKGYYVPGNRPSGDTTLIRANAGELILNRAAQGNLASQLEGGAGLGDLNLSAVIRGEQIRLVLNNNGRRTGRGEYVQSKSVK